VHVEALKEFVAPGGLVGALKEVTLGFCFVAPDALVIGSCPDRCEYTFGLAASCGQSGWRSCCIRVEVYFVEGLFVPIVAFLHVLLDVLAGYCFSKGASYVS
jgi:hypothetical protein